MKQLSAFVAIILFTCAGAKAQQKEPIYLDNGPTVFSYSYDPYFNYADQGPAMYQNNSQFYNKDNFIQNNVPTGNGQYFEPGNSNPVNNEMYNGGTAPSTVIYSGYIPVRETGANPAAGRESTYR